MLYKNDDMLKKKIAILLKNEEIDMFSLIGSVKDLFSSAYITNEIASKEVINELWISLSIIFFENKIYDNQFEAIAVMNDIFIYAQNNDIFLNLDLLKSWRNTHDTSNASPEILECVDYIIE